MLKRQTLSKQSPLPPKLPAEQWDKKLPQLPPLFHEAWLRVTPSTVLGARLTSTAPFPPSRWRPLTSHILDACLFLVQLPGPPQASTGVWGCPLLLLKAQLPSPASLYFALYRKINHLYLVPVILTVPA